MMPKKSGFLVLEKLRSRSGGLIPTIMITGNEGSRHRAYAEMLGVRDYIRKPFAMEKLVRAVERIMGVKTRTADERRRRLDQPLAVDAARIRRVTSPQPPTASRKRSRDTTASCPPRPGTVAAGELLAPGPGAGLGADALRLLRFNRTPIISIASNGSIVVSFSHQLHVVLERQVVGYRLKVAGAGLWTYRLTIWPVSFFLSSSSR